MKALATALTLALAMSSAPVSADLDPIVVLLYGDRQYNGSLDEPYDESQEYSCTYRWECENMVRTLKALHRYFESTTDTGGRDVQMHARTSSGDIGSSCAARRADAQLALNEFPDLDLAINIAGGAACFVSEMAEAGVPVASGPGFLEEVYDEVPGSIWSFSESVEQGAALSASFICQSLVGGPARFAGDPLLQTMTRKLGLVYPTQSQRGPEISAHARALRTEVQDRCGAQFVVERFEGGGTAGLLPIAANIAARMKQQEVTTLVCICIPVFTELAVNSMHAAATAIGWLPEWYWDSSSFMDRAVWQRVHGPKASGGSFGMTTMWRMPELGETDWYQAYESQEPGTTPNEYAIFRIYNALWLGYQGIANAAPDYDASSIAAGFEGVAVGDPQDPFSPLGSLGEDGPGRYSLLDSGMGFWWDELGTPPGGLPIQGCLRVVDGGARSLPGEWPAGDESLFDPDDPCTQNSQKIYVL